MKHPYMLQNCRISGLIISGCKGNFKGQHVIAAKSVNYGIKKSVFIMHDYVTRDWQKYKFDGSY
jgi:hypothetical protein